MNRSLFLTDTKFVLNTSLPPFPYLWRSVNRRRFINKWYCFSWLEWELTIEKFSKINRWTFVQCFNIYKVSRKWYPTGRRLLKWNYRKFTKSYPSSTRKFNFFIIFTYCTVSSWHKTMMCLWSTDSVLYKVSSKHIVNTWNSEWEVQYRIWFRLNMTSRWRWPSLFHRFICWLNNISNFLGFSSDLFRIDENFTKD